MIRHALPLFVAGAFTAGACAQNYPAKTARIIERYARVAKAANLTMD